MAKTIVVTGAGPLTGMALARRFGRGGFRAALIARRRESLDTMVAALAADGIEAQGFVADVTDEMALARAFAGIRSAFGAIDVLSYSPMGMTLVKPSEITAEIARERFEFLTIGAINAVRLALPDMLARRDGSILLANGRSAILPMPMIGSMTLGCTALRGYAYALHQELAPQGVQVGTVTISAGIDDAHAANIAELFWQLHTMPGEIEKVYGGDIAEMEEIAEIMKRKLG